MSALNDFDKIINSLDDEFEYHSDEFYEPPKQDQEQKSGESEEVPLNKKKKPKFKNKQKPGKPGKPKQKQPNAGKTNVKGLRIKVVVASVLLSSVLLFIKFGPLAKETASENEQTTSQTEEEEIPSEDLQTLEGGIDDPDKEEEPSVTIEDGITPGIPDMESGDNETTNNTLSDANEFVKDINGNELPKQYTVDKISYEVDFVNYTKKRGVTADGVELLWLDAEYKGNPYTIQVPFKIWKELDTTGITVVNMEVLTVNKDYKVISYMEVKDNYKEIMEEGEKALKK